MMELLLIGAGGHARACIDVIERHGQYRIAGLVGAPGETGASVFGYPVLGSDADLGALAERYRYALVAVGQIASPDLRSSLFGRLKGLGLALPVLVSPRAEVSRHACLGEGSIVMHGAIVNAGARVGRNCIINTGAVVEHDAEVGDDCHISTGVLINGGARVGAGSFVGSGSVLREGVQLGARCLIGMGQSVRHDVAAGQRLTERT